MHGHELWREALSKERDIPKSKVDAVKLLLLKKPVKAMKGQQK
jgi:hypothetical protein